LQETPPHINPNLEQPPAIWAAAGSVDTDLSFFSFLERHRTEIAVWLENARDFGEFNRVYAEFFPGKRPARSTTRAKLVVDTKVEIEVIAYKP
jgi:enamine deaminase RidA (YjgF/YER057c/UK114 family)